MFSDEKWADCNDHGGRREWVMRGQAPLHMERDRFSPKLLVWGLIGVGVKVSVMFRAREITHPEVGQGLLAEFAEALKDVADLERAPVMEGRFMTMTLDPGKKAAAAAAPKEDIVLGASMPLTGVFSFFWYLRSKFLASA